MRWLSPFLLCLFTVSSFAAAPSGIPRELARQRAQLISNLHYRLHFYLISQGLTASGEEEIRFQLKSVQPLLLDYRDGTVRELIVNGKSVRIDRQNGHLLLSIPDLRAGGNTLRIHFTSAVAPAGKALTRYEDRDDGSEYLYTLFVPMDASMAFPCFDQPDLKGRFQLTVEAPTEWTS